MAIRLDVSGEFVNGFIMSSYKTKHDSMDQQIVTTNQRIRFDKVPLALVEADIEASTRIRIQAKIRKMPVNEARGFGAKDEIDYFTTRAKMIQVRKMTLEEMLEHFKTHPEDRDEFLKSLEKDDGEE